MNILINLITAVISSFGFGIFFRIKFNKLPFAALGGLISQCIYFLSKALGMETFFAAMLSTAVTVLYSEIMARILKAPANTVLIPSIVPLLPGRNLYFMMSSAISGSLQEAIKNGIIVLENILGISVGILLAMFFFYQALNVGIQKKNNI